MRKRLGDVLVESGLLSEKQLHDALALQKTKKEKLGALLIQEGIVTKEQITDALSTKLNLPIVNVHELQIDDKLRQIVTREMASENLIFPVSFKTLALGIDILTSLN